MVMRKPGVQKPHWRACVSWKAPWRGWRPSRRREALDGAEGAAVGLHGEEEAGADGRTVELHRARSADSLLAADVGAVQGGSMADEVGKKQARLDVRLVRAPVDLDDDAARHARRLDQRPMCELAEQRATPVGVAPVSARSATAASAASSSDPPEARSASAARARTGTGPAASRARRRIARADDRRRSREREVAVRPRVLHEGASAPRRRRRHLDLHQQLVRLERSREEAEKELVGARRPARRAGSERGSARRARAAPPAARRTDPRARPTRRPSRGPDLRVPDEARRLCQERPARGNV